MRFTGWQKQTIIAPTPHIHIALLVALAASMSVACTGRITEQMDESAPEIIDGHAEKGVGAGEQGSPQSPVRPGQTPVAEAPQDCSVDRNVGASPLRRLSRTEYRNAVRDLVGVDVDASAFISGDEKISVFDANVSIAVDELKAEQYLAAAEWVSEKAVEDLQARLACEDDEVNDECAIAYLVRTAERAHRQPLQDREREAVTELYQAVSSEFDIKTGVQAGLMGILQSGSFLYRLELSASTATEADLVSVGSFDVAERLAFLVWQSVPDDELWEAAQRGELETAEQIEAQTRRMLADPRAEDMLVNFHMQWFELDDVSSVSKSQDMYPDFDEDLLNSMVLETESFVRHVMTEEGGSLEALFTSPYTFVDARLAELYQVEPPEGEGFVRRELDPAKRAGFLTHPSIMTRFSGTEHSSPTLRGYWARKRLLCEAPSSAPANIEPPEFPEGISTRRRHEILIEEPACGSCHMRMDQVGFAFEHYDAIGQWREREGEHEVNAHSEIVETKDLNGELYGAVEFAGKLVEAEQVQRCVTQQWFRFAFGRLESDFDRCGLEHAFERYRASGFDARELIVALSTSDAFRFKRVD